MSGYTEVDGSAVFEAIMKARFAMVSGDPYQPEQFLTALEAQGYTVVAFYNPERSLMHPIDHFGLNEIAEAHERASKKHGHYETWMATYNACIRQGEIAASPPTTPAPERTE